MTDRPPACPDCETDVYVGGDNGTHDWRCHLCGDAFDHGTPTRDPRRPEFRVVAEDV